MENSNDQMELEHENVDCNMNLVTKLFNSEKLTRFYNKLHLLRSDFKYICLDGDDGCKCSRFFLRYKTDQYLIISNIIGPPDKPNGFLLSNIPASCSQAILYTVF